MSLARILRIRRLPRTYIRTGENHVCSVGVLCERYREICLGPQPQESGAHTPPLAQVYPGPGTPVMICVRVRVRVRVRVVCCVLCVCVLCV